jgi:hypothetical protein
MEYRAESERRVARLRRGATMPELLTDEEIEAITKAAYTGGKGDPERDVRRLLMHIEVLEKGHRFFLVRREVLRSDPSDPYYWKKREHETAAFATAYQAQKAAEEAADRRRMGL